MTPTTPLQRALFALPVLIAAAAVGVATKTGEVPVALVGAALACTLAGPRVTLSPESQHVTAGVTLVPALVLAKLVPEDHELLRMNGTWATMAIWSVLAAATRLVMVAPVGGVRAVFGFCSIGMILAAWLHVTAGYGAFAWSFVAACVLAARVNDPHRAPWSRLSGRERAFTVGLVAASVALASASAVGLPRLHAWVMNRASNSTLEATTSGFNPWLDLGESQSIELSEEIVMRVYGPAPGHLRGVVYSQYDQGRWRIATPPPTLTATRIGPLPDRDAVTIERVGAPTMWYFLPLAARSLSTETGMVRRGVMGSVRTPPGETWATAWYRPGLRDIARPAPPGPHDLSVPAALRRQLLPLVERWTAPTQSSEAKMDSLSLHLEREYRYALRFSRTPHVDPVVDFLTRHRQGHCEYFASALALLGRVAGVPTRVVGGYRVGERNPLGGYRVVREKNAHAWVEAWTDGRWQTFDATPAGATPQNELHDSAWYRALEDAVARGYRRALNWSTGQGSTALLAAAGVLLVGWLSWRIVRLRKRREDVVADDAPVDAPLQCLEALNAALARRGIVRETGETLERFASRVEQQPELPEAASRDVARLLRDYAALRYGSVGDEPALARAMLDQARVLGAPPPPA